MAGSMTGSIVFLLMFFGLEYALCHMIDFSIPYEKAKTMRLRCMRFLFPHDKNYPDRILPLTFLLQIAAMVLCAAGLATVVSTGIVLGEIALRIASIAFIAMHLLFMVFLTILQAKYKKKEYDIPEPDQEELDTLQPPLYLGRKEMQSTDANDGNQEPKSQE